MPSVDTSYNIPLSRQYRPTARVYPSGSRGRGIGFCCVVFYHFARGVAGIEYISDGDQKNRSCGTRATVGSRTKLLSTPFLRSQEEVKSLLPSLK